MAFFIDETLNKMTIFWAFELFLTFFWFLRFSATLRTFPNFWHFWRFWEEGHFSWKVDWEKSPRKSSKWPIFDHFAPLGTQGSEEPKLGSNSIEADISDSVFKPRRFGHFWHFCVFCYFWRSWSFLHSDSIRHLFSIVSLTLLFHFFPVMLFLWFWSSSSFFDDLRHLAILITFSGPTKIRTDFPIFEISDLCAKSWKNGTLPFLAILIILTHFCFSKRTLCGFFQTGSIRHLIFNKQFSFSKKLQKRHFCHFWRFWRFSENFGANVWNQSL